MLIFYMQIIDSNTLSDKVRYIGKAFMEFCDFGKMVIQVIIIKKSKITGYILFLILPFLCTYIFIL